MKPPIFLCQRQSRNKPAKALASTSPFYTRLFYDNVIISNAYDGHRFCSISLGHKYFMKFCLLYFSAFLWTQGSLALAAEAWQCAEWNFRFQPQKGQFENFKTKACYREKDDAVQSQNCQKHPNACLAKGKKTKVQLPEGIGNPIWAECYSLGGVPRFLEIQAKNKWIESSACFFSPTDFLDFETIHKVARVP